MIPPSFQLIMEQAMHSILHRRADGARDPRCGGWPYDAHAHPVSVVVVGRWAGATQRQEIVVQLETDDCVWARPVLRASLCCYGKDDNGNQRARAECVTAKTRIEPSATAHYQRTDTPI